MSNLQTFIQENQFVIEQNLAELINELKAPTELKDAMAYSLLAGGKRIRPLYVLAVLEELQVKNEDAVIVASTIEMIHYVFANT